MIEQKNISKSLTDQILDQMYIELEKHGEFNASLIEKLKELAKNDSLKKSNEVVRIIKST